MSILLLVLWAVGWVSALVWYIRRPRTPRAPSPRHPFQW